MSHPRPRGDRCLLAWTPFLIFLLASGVEPGSAYGPTALAGAKKTPVNKFPPPPAEVVIKPKPYFGAFRNPLMGFIGPINGKHEYATLAREYVKWNTVENSATDGVEKLIAYSDAHWSHVAEKNLKIIPRVFLEWPKAGSEAYWPIDSYWPADLPRDWNSAQFKERVVRMVAKMGEAWDNDPRIAFIEMGIIGPWGEQHHPSPTLEMQKLLGDAFQKAFTNKLVMNRYPWEFTNYNFGIHWDSFGNPGWEMTKHVPELEGALAERWKIAPMGGEMAFELYTNSPKPRLAKTPTDAVANHAATLIRYIRRWHWNSLGWVSNYDAKNPDAARNAARIQSAFGYRFVLDEVRYPARVEPGETFSTSFSVRNLGSAPMYYNWSVEVSLLDEKSHEPVWKATFKELDIRQWLPGDFSEKGKGRPTGDKANAGFEWDTGREYDLAAGTNKVQGEFKLPKTFPAGEYILALAILDPAGGLPSARFATANYFAGGRHPLGRIGVGVKCAKTELDESIFGDLGSDTSLHYVVDQENK